PTQIVVRVQSRTPGLVSDLAWQDVDPSVATVRPDIDVLGVVSPRATRPVLDGHLSADSYLVLWAGTVTLVHRPVPGAYRLLVEEREFISANYVLEGGRTAVQPSRPIFA